MVIVSVKMFTLPLEKELLLEEAAPFTGLSLVVVFSNFYSSGTLFSLFFFFSHRASPGPFSKSVVFSSHSCIVWSGTQ